MRSRHVAARITSADDLAYVHALLAGAGLPTSDLASARPEFVAIRAGGAVVAAGALQRFGRSALLRSVVVSADHRGLGLGDAIVAALEQAAREAQIERLILLTQTAASFFARHGYRAIERGEVPAHMQASDEFRSLCPSSAACMAKSLT